MLRNTICKRKTEDKLHNILPIDFFLTHSLILYYGSKITFIARSFCFIRCNARINLRKYVSERELKAEKAIHTLKYTHFPKIVHIKWCEYIFILKS